MKADHPDQCLTRHGATRTRRPGRAAVLLLALAGMLGGCAALGTAPQAADAAAQSSYQPMRGQTGKDVMWIPTPDQMVTRMLQLARITREDRLADLGSGDGKIVIAAARDFGTRGRGIEYNGKMVELSRQRAAAAGVAALTRFEQGDIFKTDFSDATVVTMYLLPELNLRLRSTLFTLKPGTRIVSHQWTMGHWQPDETTRIGGIPLYLWLIPANLGGQWTIEFPASRGSASATLNFTQRFQQLTRAEIELDGMRNTLRDAAIEGEHVRFAFTDSAGVLRRFEAQVSGATMRGQVSGSDGSNRSFEGRRVTAAPPIPGSTGFSEEEAIQGTIELGG